MNQTQLSAFAVWQNFYVVIGSAAGALTGLQFVVITLIAQTRAAGSMREIRAFGTPTVTHFCTALLLAALMTAPWPTLASFGFCVAICGTLGFVYSTTIVWHARKSAYRPDLEDWIWYTGLPFVAHLVLIVAAVPLWRNAAWALVLIAVDTLFFLLLGVRNAWDTVTYIATNKAQHGHAGNQETRASSEPEPNR